MLVAGFTLETSVCAGIGRRKINTTVNYGTVAGKAALVGEYSAFMGVATYTDTGCVGWSAIDMVGCSKVGVCIGGLSNYTVMTGCTTICIRNWIRYWANTIVLCAAAMAGFTANTICIVG